MKRFTIIVAAAFLFSGALGLAGDYVMLMLGCFINGASVATLGGLLLLKWSIKDPANTCPGWAPRYRLCVLGVYFKYGG